MNSTFTPKLILDLQAAREAISHHLGPYMRRLDGKTLPEQTLYTIFNEILSDLLKAAGPSQDVLDEAFGEALNSSLGKFTKYYLMINHVLTEGRVKGVLNNSEAEQRRQQHSCVTSIEFSTFSFPEFENEEIRFFFLTDDHCLLPADRFAAFSPCTTYLPLKVKPRPGLEDGWINTVEDYLKVFHCNQRQISTTEELVRVLDAITSNQIPS